MKRHIGIGLLALLACGWLEARAAEPRLAFIDLDRVFNEYSKTKTADAQLKAQADEFNAERKELIAEYEKLQEEFNKLRDAAQNPALNVDAAEQKKSEAEDKLVEIREYESKIRRFDESRRKQLDDQSRRMRKNIVEEMRKIIEEYARTQGFIAVMDSSGQSLNGVESLLYVDPKYDITDAILDQLNATDTAVPTR